MNTIQFLRLVLKHPKLSDRTKVLVSQELIGQVAEPTTRPEPSGQAPPGPARAGFKMLPKERQQIIHAYQKGMTVEEIARNCQRTVGAIELIVKGYPKGETTKRPHSRRMVTQTDIDTVVREYFHNGNKPKRIGKLINRTTNAVNAIITKVKKGRYQTSVSFDRKQTSLRIKPKNGATVSVSPETKIPAHIRHFG